MEAGDGDVGEQDEEHRPNGDRDERGTVRVGWRHSSASAGPFSHPMNMYSARGKPVDNPASPPVRCAQENGAPERWPPASTRTTMQPATITASWARSATPTAEVDSVTPRAVTQIAATVSTTLMGPHGRSSDV